MKKIIFIIIILSSILFPSNLNPSYLKALYIPEYPCVIMKVPGLYQYILIEPGGKIIKKEVEIHAKK